jgi:iron complex outermembrane receptor protein
MLSAGYFGARDIIKLTAIAGLLRDTLSYLAVADTQLARDRRINPLLPTELDRFGEQLVSVAYTRTLGMSSSLSTTLYRISASGNYDVAIAPDLWNYHLDFVWYGVTSAWNWQRDGARINVGVNGNGYARDHYVFVRPDLADNVYFNTGHKGDVSGFGKVAYDVGRATLFGDLQLRRAQFRYSPDANAGIAGSSISWSFFNPKLGMSFQASPAVQVYASYGRASREPARNDMFAGFDNIDTSNVAFIGGFRRVRPETVNDVEAGLTLRTTSLRVQANAFSMDFRNEIAPIGALSYLGLPLRKNVRASWRRGLELDAALRSSRVTASANATVMDARITEYTDDASGITFHHVRPLLTPRFLAYQRLDVALTTAVSAGVEARYTGRSQLDNTGNPELVLPGSYVVNASAALRFGRHTVELRGNNLGGSRRFGSGYGSEGVPFYFVLPPPNAFLTLRLGF